MLAACLQTVRHARSAKHVWGIGCGSLHAPLPAVQAVLAFCAALEALVEICGGTNMQSLSQDMNRWLALKCLIRVFA